MTTPIKRALVDPKLTAKEIGETAYRWLTNELFPIVKAIRDVVNESATIAILQHSGDYAWDLDRYGALFIEQVSGDINVTVAAGVDVKRLRPGRTCNLVIRNNTGGNLTATFSADFKTTVPVPVVFADGVTVSWNLIIKDPGFTALTAAIIGPGIVT
jgi:hypothetical protein